MTLPNQNYKQLFLNAIPNNNLWIPPILPLSDINMDSWLSIKQVINPNSIPFASLKIIPKRLDKIKLLSKKVELILTDEQKNIINHWLAAYFQMYNCTIKHLKTFQRPKKDYYIKYEDLLRTLLKKQNDAIQADSQDPNIKRNTTIKTHDLDAAIRLACTVVETCIKNKDKGLINDYEIRYWDSNKESFIMDLEKANFSNKKITNGTIRNKVLGKVNGMYNGSQFDFKTVDHDCKLRYDTLTNKYELFVPENVTDGEYFGPKDTIIILDPGVRTFLTGVSENKVIKIGDNCREKIANLLILIDGLEKNTRIPKDKRNKVIKRHNAKITNLVDDMHWRTIDYLTKNYGMILMGNMSSKQIISNDNRVQLDAMTKRVVSRMKIFQFKQRLETKCSIRKVKYKCVNESYTSITCSVCGNINYDLGSNDVYNCSKCKTIIDRDVNGARNIYIKATL